MDVTLNRERFTNMQAGFGCCCYKRRNDCSARLNYLGPWAITGAESDGMISLRRESAIAERAIVVRGFDFACRSSVGAISD